MEYIKVSDSEIKSIETKSEVVEHTYKLSFLLEQRKTIQAQKDREIAQRDLELLTVNELIKQCGLLGIKEVAVEPIPIIKK